MSNKYQFLANATLAPAQADGKRTLSGVAYAGGIITDHAFSPRIAFDLATTQLTAPMPLLFGHDHSEVVGVVTSAIISNNITIDSTLFADIDEDAAAIAAKADAGMPWQLSVGIWPGEVTELVVGKTIEINGQQMTGPLTVFKNNVIREVSVCALGADRGTNATVFTPSSQDKPMTQETNTLEIDALTAEIEQLKATNQELTDKLQEFTANARKDKVKALFASLNRDYTDESAAVYLAMSDEIFVAVSADLTLAKPVAQDYLFNSQATSVEAPNIPSAAKRLFDQVAGK